ncbi:MULTISPECIES: hypothetical protein [unclassified Tolypothrix]|uniref:hypothetical protein n=1 Tax=unclassified Tolypothrix TaxID=2649714 RepID=UPI0005EAA774|nr:MULTISPECIES: hypothetical protein [unclassified Tolypothrix]BAY92806.1 hypothetical protein NIES3275_48430 [Microchaete diplosiphon NIES-3275]EKF04153.1 hypothetical protein FDUTEX481_02793 [Tolypothrix sp. PCC 7601]MBE9087715.1 hypothetical protein [Tolypothrix sp. LEGE 11397]UYD26724.1 hypothetical protein HGR01_00970 [Tolypothrix sp. PCC 7712]UYD37415.1 hypothetical protein HG267_17840 [Tolypothrix sp. PCC 7601]
MAITTADMMKMSPAELDQLYQNSPVGEIPSGQGRGTVVFVTGLPERNFLAALVRLLAWQGKIFYRNQNFLLNSITILGLKLVKAKVYRGESWFSQGEAIILDYSQTSFIAQKIRDEIREVAPGVFLGQAYWSKTRVLCFALEF